MSAASFCWQCGKKLNVKGGELVFRLVIPRGFDSPVRVHVICAENFAKPEPSCALRGTKDAVNKYLTGEPHGR